MVSPLAVVRLRAGDTKPRLRVRHTAADNVPVDYAHMTVRLRIARGENDVLEKTAILTDASKGEFIITWDATDLTPGKHPGLIRFIDADGLRLSTHNIIFDVAPDI